MSLTSRELFSLSTELVELKIEEFLASYGEKLNSLTEEAFNTQVCACVCFILCICELLLFFFNVMEKLQQMHHNQEVLEMSKVVL